MKFVTILVAMTTIYGGLNYYVALKIFRWLQIFMPAIDGSVYTVVYVFLALSMLLGYMPLPETLKKIMSIIGAYWIGIFVYVLMLFVIFDVVVFSANLMTIVPRFMKQDVNLYVGYIVLLMTMGLVGYGLYNARQIKTTFYEIKLKKMLNNPPIKMVLFSDLHLGAVNSEMRLAQIVQKVNQLKPDLVCIPGDIFNDDFDTIMNPTRAGLLLKSIRATYGVYACLGNHDGGNTFDKMTQFLAQNNVKLLNDESVLVGERLILFGRVDPSPIGGFGGLERVDLTDSFASLETDLPVVVMDHTPSKIETYGNEVDLIVSGHTHQGQLFPANLITSKLFVVDYGHYQKEETSPHVIVTSGVGTWGMPMRIGTKSEVVMITLG